MMKVLLLVLLAATVSYGTSILGDIKCTYGPSYWCQNYKQAKECHAIQHCKEKVWKASKPNDLTCALCEGTVGVLEKELKNTTVQKLLLSRIEEVCVRFSALAPECKAMIEKYAPGIFKKLIQMMANPKTACTEFGLCKASKKKIMAVLLQKALPVKLKAFAGRNSKIHAKRILKATPVKTSAECILCEFVADKLDQMLTKNATQQEIKNALDKVCSLLPSDIGTECKEFVDKYSDMIILLLSQELSPKMLCSALGLCGSKAQMKKLHSNGQICDFCTTAFTFLKNMLQDNATQKEFLDELKEFCKDLPEQLQSECTSVVDQYGPKFIKFLASADPKTLCTDIGLCTSKVKPRLHDIIGVKDKCYLGASYWCANHANAARCNETAFCVKHAW